MAGQVMEAHHHQAARLQSPTMAPPLAPLLPHNTTCKHDVHHHHATSGGSGGTTSSVTTGGGAAVADMAAAYLQQLQDAAAAAEAAKQSNGSGNGGGAARGEQCPRCASHDTKFCYYNNYNTSQPRHFCRACRRYWTLGGSLRNVPIGGSTRKRPRLAHNHHQHPHATRRAPAAAHVFGLGLAGGAAPPPPPMMMPSQGQGGGLLSSLFALGAAGAPLLEGRGAGPSSSSFDLFDLGLGLPTGPLHHLGAGAGAGEAAAVQMQGLGLRGGVGGGSAAGSSSSFLWPPGAGMLVDNDSVDTWKLPGSMWPADFSSPAAQTGGMMLHGGAGGHLM